MSKDLKDLVDLTDSPAPAEKTKPSAQATKRQRDDAEIIDFVSREDIMKFAAKANQKQRVTSPLNDSTGQTGNVQEESSAKADNLWLKQLWSNRIALRGEPSNSNDPPEDQPARVTATGAEAGPSGRQASAAKAPSRQQSGVTLITWNVWCASQ